MRIFLFFVLSRDAVSNILKSISRFSEGRLRLCASHKFWRARFEFIEMVVIDR